MTHTHDIVYLEYGGMTVPIDTQIAPLMQAIWNCGARTTSSCEDIGDLNANPDNRGLCLIQFLDAIDALRFLNAATVFEPGGTSLFNRMSHCGCRGVLPWKYSITPYDRAYSDKDCYNGPAEYGFLVTICFPRSDIATILRNLTGNSSG